FCRTATLSTLCLSLFVTCVALSVLCKYKLPTEAQHERNCKRCPESWRLFKNKCYFFSSRTLTWSSSRAWCQTQGGDLLVIDSDPEQVGGLKQKENMKLLYHSGSKLWIGMTDADVEGEWSWVDGRIGTEPDDWRQEDPLGEDCGHIDTSENALTSWMDGSCKKPYGWICEKEVGTRASHSL
uniref:C-type lectin domain-containing protein n=1 Tax=Labrus bergylta TaxID=56723 RepID=A0A3Q3EYZ7_9LABR